MAHPLQSDDITLLSALKERGVLLPIRPEQIPSAAFVWSCGDGDRHEQLVYLFHLMHGKDTNKQITPHLFCWNGGPLVLASSFGDDVAREFAYRQFAGAVKLKPHIKAVILQGHAVCGAAHTSGHGLRNTALLFKQAVTELKQFVRHHHLDITTFVALFHVDYGNGLMRTYTFNADIFQ